MLYYATFPVHSQMIERMEDLQRRVDAGEDGLISRYEILRLLYKAMAFANMTKEQYTKITSIMRTQLDIMCNWPEITHKETQEA